MPMSTEPNAFFQVTSWDEKPYEEFDDGGKLTRAHVVYTYRGAIAGTGTAEYLMVYGLDKAAHFVGAERVLGHVDGKPGSFVLRHVGTYGAEGVRTTITVVPGAGTGELKGLRGSIEFRSSHQSEYPIVFDHHFE
jgi:hypothetical protein